MCGKKRETLINIYFKIIKMVKKPSLNFLSSKTLQNNNTK